MEWDFKEVDDIEAVPEKYRSLYETKPNADGKFVPVALIAPLVEAYKGTNKALVEERTKRKSVNKESADRRTALKSFEGIAEEFGLDVKDKDVAGAIKAFIAAQMEAAKNGQDTRVNLEKIKADFEKKMADISTAKDAEISKRDAALSRYLVDQSATAALAESKGSVDLLLPHIQKSVKVVADGDNYEVRVVDSQGDFRTNGAGGFMTVKDLVTEMKSTSTFARAFDSETKGGTGSPPGGMQRKTPVNNSKDMSSTDKISAGLKQGGYVKGGR